MPRSVKTPGNSKPMFSTTGRTQTPRDAAMARSLQSRQYRHVCSPIFEKKKRLGKIMPGCVCSILCGMRYTHTIPTLYPCRFASSFSLVHPTFQKISITISAVVFWLVLLLRVFPPLSRHQSPTNGSGKQRAKGRIRCIPTRPPCTSCNNTRCATSSTSKTPHRKTTQRPGRAGTSLRPLRYHYATAKLHPNLSLHGRYGTTTLPLSCILTCRYLFLAWSKR